MIHIEGYISDLTSLLMAEFGERLVYLGLQGSYLRGEAHEGSDLDIMVVIDGLNVDDLETYRSAIQSLDHYDKSCGFICSREDLKHWNPLEICNLLHSTKDYHGVLAELVPDYTKEDIRNFIKFSINGLYHEICHRFIHSDAETNIACLPGSFKAVFFILQNYYYLSDGVFIGTRAEMLSYTQGIQHDVMERAMELSGGGDYDFRESFELLLTWCRQVMATV